MPVVDLLSAALEGRAVGRSWLGVCASAGLSTDCGEAGAIALSVVRRGVLLGALLGSKLGAWDVCARCEVAAATDVDAVRCGTLVG
jgi:hypothetical protein